MKKFLITSLIILPVMCIAQGGKLFTKSTMTPDPKDAIRMPAGNPQLLTTDKHTWNEYLLYVVSQKQANELSLMLLHISLEKKLNELMKELQSEYNLH